MKYRQQKLDNGLTILAECNELAHFLSLGFFVRTGARDESAADGGVSHFLEHMVFKGTPTKSADDVNLLLDDMGSSSNARTGEESTIYHASVLPEFQAPMLGLLADLMRPALRDEDFETEKKVIIEEIMMYDDQPPWGGYERLMQDYFGPHRLGQSVLGSVETVSALTPEAMRRYHTNRYSPDNIAIVVSGKTDFDSLVRDAEQLCGSWQPRSIQRDIQPAVAHPGLTTMVRAETHLQYLMHLAPGPSVDSGDRYAIRLLCMILGDTSGSRVFWELLDTGLAESAGIGGYEYLGSGLIMSYFSCVPEKAHQNAEILYKILATSTKGVTERELEISRQKIISQILLSSERTGSRMFSVGGQWLNGQPFLAPAEIAECYRQVTLDQVNEVAVRWPLKTGRTLTSGTLTDLVWPD